MRTFEPGTRITGAGLVRIGVGLRTTGPGRRTFEPGRNTMEVGRHLVGSGLGKTGPGKRKAGAGMRTIGVESCPAGPSTLWCYLERKDLTSSRASAGVSNARHNCAAASAIQGYHDDRFELIHTHAAWCTAVVLVVIGIVALSREGVLTVLRGFSRKKERSAGTQ